MTVSTSVNVTEVPGGVWGKSSVGVELGVSKRWGWMKVETKITKCLDAGQGACRFSSEPLTLNLFTKGTALGSGFRSTGHS